MGGPIGHIASMEELENVLLIGMDLYVVFHDSHLFKMYQPKIVHRNGRKELRNANHVIQMDILGFDKDDVGAFLFVEYEPARKWSYEVFQKRAAGDRRWTV